MITRLRLRRPPEAKKVFEINIDGPIGRWFARRHWRAFTFPLPFCYLILYWCGAWKDPYFRLHESVHVRQGDGKLFLLAWYQYLRAGRYATNKFEIEAYAVEDAARADSKLLPDWA